MSMVCRSLIAIALMVTLAVGKEDLEQEIKNELKKLEGTWQLSSAVVDGKETAEDTIKKIRVVIHDGKHAVYFGDDVVVKEIPFTINPTVNPKQTTDTLPDGRTIKGIYKIDGDTLTSCMSAIGKDPPTEFLSKPNSGYSLRVFKRRRDIVQEPIEGTWVPVTAELAGSTLPAETLKSWKLILKSDSYSFKNGPETDLGTLKFDTTKSPPEIDIVGTDGPNKGKTILAIYELAKDTLKVCYDLGGKSRPMEFVSKSGTQLLLVTYTREKP